MQGEIEFKLRTSVVCIRVYGCVWLKEACMCSDCVGVVGSQRDRRGSGIGSVSARKGQHAWCQS